MISICTQFYDKDYNKIPTFIDSIINTIKCPCEIIILDNRSNKDYDVFTNLISSYVETCELKYINDDSSVDVLTARKKLVEAAAGEYIWFVNVGDELTGIITQNILDYSQPDIIFFSGYDESSTKRVGLPFTELITLADNDPETNYNMLRTQIFGTWSYWFKRDFVKGVFDKLKMNSNFIEDVLLRSVSISCADTVLISPEVIYTKKQKEKSTESVQMELIDFERLLAEVEQAKSLYEGNEFVTNTLSDEALIKHYVQKVLKSFDGTDQELIDLADRFAKVFDVDSSKVESILQGSNFCDYNETNIDRFKYLCGIDVISGKKNALSNTNKYTKPEYYNFSVRGFESKIIRDSTLTICITCYDGDYLKAEELIHSIRSNPFLKDTRILVINNCETNNINKLSDVEYIDTHKNMFAFQSRLLGAENSETDYIWFVDGDDDIKVDFELNSCLSECNSDIINFCKIKASNDLLFENNDSLCYFLLENGYDTSLHNVLFSRNVYKKFNNLPKDVIIHLGEDVFLSLYGMLNSNNISVFNKPIKYVYKENMHYLNKSFYTGYNEVLNIAKSVFPYRMYRRFVDLIMYYISEKLSPRHVKTLELQNLPYFINFFNKDFDQLELSVNDASIDIIYVYYGKDLDSELDNLEKRVKCKHNVVVIDLLGDYHGSYEVIHELTFYEALVKASKQILSDNVWILESYKIIHQFNGSYLDGHSMYFTSWDCDFNPLLRNNTIFTKDDFLKFLSDNNGVEFNTLTNDIYSFVKKQNFVKCINYLVEADLFDESDINFIFVNLDNFLEKSNIAQLCISNVKDTFKNSNIIIYDEDKLKPLIDSSKITQDIIELRNQTSYFKCFEDDIIRLLLVQSNKKSIYVDMDITITDKNKFLKMLSTYPTFCQYNGNESSPVIYNELIWSLNGSSFINENINFYKDVSVDTVCNLEEPLYNGAVASKIIHKFGGRAFAGTFNVLDLYSTSVYKDDLYFHFRSSRFSYFGDKQNIKIGITTKEFSSDTYLTPFIKNNELDAVYVLCDWKDVNTYHSFINDCYVTDIGIYKGIQNTVSILVKSVERDGVKVTDTCYFDGIVNDIQFHDVVQYFPSDSGYDGRKNYRRFKLSNWLSQNYDYAKADERCIGSCNTLIISKPNGWKIIAENIKHNTLIFDRSDYWVGDGVTEETELLSKADIVINSTDFLYHDSLKYNKNSYLIYNGSTVREYKKLPKIDKYVYIGRSGKKIDWEWMNSLDLPVDVYGEIDSNVPDCDNITMMGYKTEEELTEILSQYQAGLVGFNTNEFNKGMLPIKIFNYLDAGLEIITHNCPEADNYLKYHKDEPHDWNVRFNEFEQFIDMGDKMNDVYILQFLKLFSSERNLKTSNYRRLKLRKFLAKKYGSRYKSLVNFNDFEKGHYPVLLISTSIGWESVVDNCTYNLLVYDRTDNWGALSEDNLEEEDKLIKKADIVFNSSKFLFEDSKSKRKMYQQTYFIPNGCTVKEYKPVEKYPNPTAAYIGKSTSKIDWEKIKEVSKDYKVLLYGDFNQVPDDLGDNVEYKGYLDEYELHNELCKCHVGLIPFVDGDWTRGMLPLKLFNYANAHIPTLYWNCPECDNYPTIASSTEVLNPTDEDFNKVLADADWNAKFKAMHKIIEDNMKGAVV